MAGINHDKLRHARERRNIIGWKPREGANTVRILPPGSRFLDDWDLLEEPAVRYNVHFIKVEGAPATVTRCYQDLKQKCTACDISRAHAKSSDPGLAEMAKQVRRSEQFLFNILDFNNLKGGIQPWAANFTCWDKIIEVAGIASWGNVFDPDTGRNFTVNLTPGTQSKTGRNQYSVLPDPEKRSILAVLNSIPDWRAALDKLEENIQEVKSTDEIIAALTEVGFPMGNVRRSTPAAAPAPAPTAPASQPATTAAMAPVAPQAVAPQAEVPVAAAPAPVVVASSAHYDPGAAYTPVIADDQRPSGAPRCFGDYAPQVHRCQPCPLLVDCQLAAIDLPG